MPPQTWYVAERPLAQDVLIAALLLLLLFVRAASAHGDQDTIVIDNAAAGPYRLTAWVAPEVVRTGSVHFAALVVVDGTPMSDCDVFIEVIPLDHNGPVLSARMRPASVSHHFQHEVELNLATEGRYEGRVTVRDRAGNGGWATFAMAVRPSSAWMVALIYSQLVIAPFIGFWLLKEAIGAWLPQMRKHNNGKRRQFCKDEAGIVATTTQWSLAQSCSLPIHVDRVWPLGRAHCAGISSIRAGLGQACVRRRAGPVVSRTGYI